MGVAGSILPMDGETDRVVASDGAGVNLFLLDDVVVVGTFSG